MILVATIVAEMTDATIIARAVDATKDVMRFEKKIDVMIIDAMNRVKLNRGIVDTKLTSETGVSIVKIRGKNKASTTIKR